MEQLIVGGWDNDGRCLQHTTFLLKIISPGSDKKVLVISFGYLDIKCNTELQMKSKLMAMLEKVRAVLYLTSSISCQ